MSRIGVILGSTRPRRISESIGQWAIDHFPADSENTYEVIDLRDHPLPFYDEPQPPRAAQGNYHNEHTKQWAAFVSQFDGFVVILPEYNGNMPSVLKNSLDYLFTEWEGKPISYISYGSHGGTRSAKTFETATGGWGFTLVDAHLNLHLSRDFFDEEGKLKDPAESFKEHEAELAAIDAALSNATQ